MMDLDIFRQRVVDDPTFRRAQLEDLRIFFNSLTEIKFQTWDFSEEESLNIERIIQRFPVDSVLVHKSEHFYQLAIYCGEWFQRRFKESNWGLENGRLIFTFVLPLTREEWKIHPEFEAFQIQASGKDVPPALQLKIRYKNIMRREVNFLNSGGKIQKDQPEYEETVVDGEAIRAAINGLLKRPKRETVECEPYGFMTEHVRYRAKWHLQDELSVETYVAAALPVVIWIEYFDELHLLSMEGKMLLDDFSDEPNAWIIAASMFLPPADEFVREKFDEWWEEEGPNLMIAGKKVSADECGLAQMWAEHQIKNNPTSDKQPPQRD